MYAKDRNKIRVKQPLPDRDCIIINTDAVTWLDKQLKSNPKLLEEFDTIIIDEMASFKHRTSMRSKAAGRVVKHFRFRAGLTGTPNSRTITDIWHQVKLLDDGQHLGRVFSQFRDSVCEPVRPYPSAPFVEWQDKEDIELVVGHLLRDISIRHQFDDCMDIPPNTVHTISFDLSPSLRAAYDKMAETALLQLTEGDVKAVNAAVLANKLLQVASGAAYSAEEQYQVISDERYRIIADLIEARKHSVVFYNWRHQKEQLMKLLSAQHTEFAVLDSTVSDRNRTQIVQDYQKGKYQALLLHWKTGAHGLTLTKGTSTIACSPIYEPDYLKQGIHRIHRGGQTQKTETILIRANNTIEQQVYDKLEQKNVRMMNLLEVLRG